MTSRTSPFFRAGLAARLCAVAVAVFVVGAAFAQAALPQVDAEVRRVDAAQQKVTLRHAEIPNLQMGAMTMVFRVRDPALLEGLKAGDAVRVTVEQVDGALVVQTLEARP